MPVVVPVQYGPNSIELEVLTGATGWHIIATDGTGYTTPALMLAAGKKPFPSLPLGSIVASLETKGIAAGGGAPGSPYYISINPAGGTPTIGKEVGGNDQAFVFGPGQINTLWINLTVGSDTPELYLTY